LFRHGNNARPISRGSNAAGGLFLTPETVPAKKPTEPQ